VAVRPLSLAKLNVLSGERVRCLERWRAFVFDHPLKIKSVPLLAAAAVFCCCGLAVAEVIYLKNGDVLHGTVVGATSLRVTFQTPYGKLNIPKKDIQRIEYEDEEGGPTTTKKPAPPSKAPVAKAKPDLRPTQPSRPVVSLEIRGRAFWYAFQSPPDNPADLSIRLRIFLGEDEAAMLLDSKPDTYDRNTYYNSFTFSPSDSQVVKTGEGYDCEVKEAEDGRVVLTLQLPEEGSEGRIRVHMLYQINQGDRALPRWIDAVSRSFSTQVRAGQESYVVIEQDSSGLEYSGFFRKTMKNVESFQLDVSSSELRELPTGPGR
jgi:hypothetical protein